MIAIILEVEMQRPCSPNQSALPLDNNGYKPESESM